MARLIRADGTEEIVTARRGKKFTLDKLQKFVGGPSVCAICLTADRPQMTAQAVQSFMAQDYPRELRKLIIWDTGKIKYATTFIGIEVFHREPGRSIGMLRNEANKEAKADVIVTMDSDDWSSPERISEQVALLQSSGADCVGYNEVLFWDDRPGQFCGWLYSSTNKHYAIGGSLCYWRTAWERRPFRDLPKRGANGGQCEDDQFVKNGQQCVGVSSIVAGAPRLIARIHSGNTSDYGKMLDAVVSGRASKWKRLPVFDETWARWTEAVEDKP